ncbi:LysR family transcriptional regulator [Leisingera daeponensis]|uniref:LysR family transcriptional regulator n=1 Tax=Leisingera daeponensis TaxID=405746 RepID=A0ABS7NJW8_9RHOB|nr:LysR family transcriptional regulator [Leisingera daeponensis]MBY6141505.1 LysR family transcriptional regulator [Leisingera daeponensis]
MDDLNELRICVRVAEAGSFAEAARTMGLTTSSVSKAVRRLEGKIGAKLFTRTTRAVSRTSEGERFLEGAKRVLEEAETLKSEIMDSVEDPRGRLVISASDSVGRLWMTQRVLAFMCRYRNVDVELVFDDRVVDLAAEGVDVAVRAGNLGSSPDLIARKLYSDNIVTCAAPRYLERTGKPETVADLAGHRAIYYRGRNSGRLTPFQFRSGGEIIQLQFDPVLVVNSVDALSYAGSVGIGIVQLPGQIARAAIAEGKLVEILPDCQVEDFAFRVVYRERRLIAPRIRAFVDFLVANPPSPEELHL